MVYKATSNINLLQSDPTYLIWWQHSDAFPDLMRQCEVMSKLVCRASKLKVDNLKLRKEVWSERSCLFVLLCESCNFFESEDAKHLILRCTRLDDLRRQMFTSINESCNGIGRQVLDNTDDLLAMLLIKHNHTYSDEINWEIMCITAIYVYQMCNRFIRERDRVR